MTWLKSIVLEVYGLFVDDGRFAVTVIVWLGIAALILPRLHVPADLNAPILFAGLLLVLLESTLRRASR